MSVAEQVAPVRVVKIAVISSLAMLWRFDFHMCVLLHASHCITADQIAGSVHSNNIGIHMGFEQYWDSYPIERDWDSCSAHSRNVQTVEPLVCETQPSIECMMVARFLAIFVPKTLHIV